MKIGQLISQARERAGLSLQEVADGSGSSKGYIHDIEHGRANNISLRTAIKLSICLSIPINIMAASVLQDDPPCTPP